MVDTLSTLNARRWATCKINPNKDAEFTKVANKLLAAKDRYKAVEAKTGVPWWFVAVVHLRESSQNWKGSLAQGDPWNKVSTHVPKGRGPFNSWEEAAIDALVNCHPHAARNKDWSVGGTLALLERYNGLGYSRRGIPSPYIWAGTNQYVKGKYVSDGVFDPNHVDKQLGCAGLLKKLGAFNTTSVPQAGAILGGIAASTVLAVNWPYIFAGVAAVALVGFIAYKLLTKRK